MSQQVIETSTVMITKTNVKEINEKVWLETVGLLQQVTLFTLNQMRKYLDFNCEFIIIPYEINYFQTIFTKLTRLYMEHNISVKETQRNRNNNVCGKFAHVKEKIRIACGLALGTIWGFLLKRTVNSSGERTQRVFLIIHLCKAGNGPQRKTTCLQRHVQRSVISIEVDILCWTCFCGFQVKLKCW